MRVTERCQSETDTFTLIWLGRCSFLSPAWGSGIRRVCLQMSKRAHVGSTHLANIPEPSQLSYPTYTVAVLLLVSFTIQQILEYVHPGKEVLTTSEVIVKRN